MDFKDPTVQKGIIVVILCMMVAYVYYFTSFLPFFYHPMRARIASLSSEYEKMSAELEKARRTVDNLPRLEKEYERLHEKWLAAGRERSCGAPEEDHKRRDSSRSGFSSVRTQSSDNA